MNSQLPNNPHHGNPERVKRVEVYWHAVSYKTIILYLLILVGLISGVAYFVSPNVYTSILRKITAAGEAETAPLTMTQAKFVNLDGRVQVKKVNSVQWVDADLRTTLDKGDLIQTASDGAARITFADNTSYTIKAETLVTVEENNVTREQSSTAVRVNVGAVDLSTPSSPNSHTAVSVEDAVAQVRPNSRATVESDPKSQESKILVAGGSAEVQRAGQRVELNQWQRADIRSGSPMTVSDALAPPDLSQPLNLAPIIVEVPRAAPIRFEWKPVKDAVAYTLRVSTNSMFSKIIKQAKVGGTSTEVSGFDAGDYFWDVIATDSNKQNSEVSETFKFTLVAQGRTQEMVLQVDGTRLNGRSVEIFGKTEPGAALIINGQPVPNISPDGGFRYFTEPLEPGEHSIVIVGQNRRGGTAKQTVPIVVPK